MEIQSLKGRESADHQKERLKKILSRLKRYYPNSQCALDFETPFQLLIATILSAQCTDERVNIVTKDLFAKYPDSKTMSKASLEELENIVRPTGFFKNKAKSLSNTSKRLHEEFKGKVPESLEILVTLAGVGRKTANVVLGVGFGKPAGVVVDTHVGRLSRRLGFTKLKDPTKVALHLEKVAPKKVWTDLPLLLIDHGRAVCKARKPQCDVCGLEDLCRKWV